MAHTYILFDFGADEENAQKARHKLEGWKQAFRLDKKLQFKFERGENPVTEATAKPKSEPEPEKPKSKAKSKAKTGTAAAPVDANSTVKLLVRLYFSPHEKLSEQSWLDRIPGEEPFKSAVPKVIQESAAEFPETLKHFESLE